MNETLDKIRSWDVTGDGTKDLMEFVKSEWLIPESVHVRKGFYCFGTLGYPEHEAMIRALQDNNMFWLFCFEMNDGNITYVFRTSEANPFDSNPFYEWIDGETK